MLIMLMTIEEAITLINSTKLMLINPTDNEPISDLYTALNMAIQALKQEPNRDMEEIAEIMKSDADAETKCKMISNILTAKPHYFELSQEPTIQDKQAESEKYQKAYDDGYDNGYAQARFDYEQEPCDDTVSRQAALNSLIDNTNLDGYDLAEALDAIKNKEKLPSVTQKLKTGHWIFDETLVNWRCSKCNETPKTMGYVGTADFMAEHFKFCNHCGAKMVEPQESEE